MNTRQSKAASGNRVAIGVLIIILSLFCLLSGVGAFAGVGDMVNSFTIGFFGLAIYAYSVMGILIGLAICFRIKVKLPFSKVIILFAMFALVVLALQIYTSSSHIVDASYSNYLLNCYYSANTAGGMLYAIIAYPLMKSITTVGALSLVCALFFAIAIFSVFPVIKNNVTYSVKNGEDRKTNRKFTPSEKSVNALGTKIGAHKKPTLIDFSKNDTKNGLFVVNVDGAQTPTQNRGIKGVSGYSPLNTSNVLGYEDEQVDTKIQSKFSESKFNKRNLARDVLFGNDVNVENYDRLVKALDPEKSLNDIGSSYTSLKRNEMRSKLGIDMTSQGIRDDLMSRYDLNNTTQAEIVQPYDNNINNGVENSINRDFSKFGATPDFHVLKAEQKKLFSNMGNPNTPEFEAVAYQKNVNEYNSTGYENTQVVKPTKNHSASINSTIERAQNAVSNPSNQKGMKGAVVRAVSKEESKTKKKQEFESQAYDYTEIKTDSYSIAKEGKMPRAFIRAVVEPIVEVNSANCSQDNLNEFSFDNSKSSSDNNNGYAYQNRVNSQSLESQTPVYENFSSNQNNIQNPSDITQDNVGVMNVFGGSFKPYKQEGLNSKREQDVINRAEGLFDNKNKFSKNNVDTNQSAFIKTDLTSNLSKPQKASLMNRKSKIEVADNDNLYDIKAEKVKASRSRGLNKTETSEKQNNKNVQEDVKSVKKPVKTSPYVAPPLNLLRPPDLAVAQNEDFEARKRALMRTLDSFGIGSEVIDVRVGPTFTLYTMKVNMPKGKSVGVISGYENDFEMNMEAKSVRVLAPIPGMNAVGIEVPNKHRRIVRLSELLISPAFNKAESPATFVLGKNLYGQDFVCDIKSLPHMLIAGATGAGKSCCINSLIVSLLYKASPEDLRLILIDPKRVELSIYQGIPHLLLDEIVCDVDKAIRALNWSIGEMERRIKYFASLRYNNIDDYNNDCKKLGYEKMPRIVIVVDELADLLAAGKKAVEDSINRIARLARAVGIHLILATQRPSVDVVSGTIKNNLPSRVAFKVTSGPDSRTILDAGGADKLLGDGDLLYMNPKSSTLERMQGAFISNQEVKKVVDFIKTNNESYFDNTIKDAIFKEKEEEIDDIQSRNAKKQIGVSQDVVDALMVGMDGESYSISKLQRKLSFGWPKAAKIYDIIMDMGYLVQDERNPKNKVIKISEEELQELIDKNAKE